MRPCGIQVFKLKHTVHLNTLRTCLKLNTCGGHLSGSGCTRSRSSFWKSRLRKCRQVCLRLLVLSCSFTGKVCLIVTLRHMIWINEPFDNGTIHLRAFVARLTSPYQLTHDTGMSPQSSDSQSAVRQEHSGWAVFIQQEAVYHQLITTYNHMYSYTMQLT